VKRSLGLRWRRGGAPRKENPTPPFGFRDSSWNQELDSPASRNKGSCCASHPTYLAVQQTSLPVGFDPKVVEKLVFGSQEQEAYAAWGMNRGVAPGGRQGARLYVRGAARLIK
jgi:hypothetical protein